MKCIPYGAKEYMLQFFFFLFLRDFVERVHFIRTAPHKLMRVSVDVNGGKMRMCSYLVSEMKKNTQCKERNSLF